MALGLTACGSEAIHSGASPAPASPSGTSTAGQHAGADQPLGSSGGASPAGPSSTAPSAPAIPPSASCTPSFQSTPVALGATSLGTWLGADAAYSVALSDTSSLWLFGDTFIGAPGTTSRTNAPMVGNTASLSTCTGGQYANNFLWQAAASGPQAFLAQAGLSTRYWPGDPWTYQGTLYIPLLAIAATSGGLGFSLANNAMAVVPNPTAPAAQWQVSYETMPTDGQALALGAGSVMDSGYVYLFNTYQNDLTLMRMPLDKLAASPGSAGSLLEYWSKSGGWQAGLNDPDAQLLGLHANSGLTVRFNQRLGKWLALYAASTQIPFTDIAVATATALTGPWSAPVTVFKIPESQPGEAVYDANAACYAAYEHLEFNPDPDHTVAFTYNCNSTAPGEQATNMSLYFPRFIRQPLPDAVK